MSHLIKLGKLVAFAGVTFGLGAQVVGGADYSGPENRQHPEDSAIVVIEPTKEQVSVIPNEALTSGEGRIVPVADDQQMASSSQEPLYRPPQRGAPGGRVGGGTRGPSMDSPLLWALVPDHVGLSTEVQPQLVWYLSKATAYPLEFTLIDEQGVTPVIEKRLSSPVEAGIHIIRLGAYDVSLEKGKTYQWFVSLISDPTHRSTDVIAGGMIRVGEVPASVGENVRNAKPVEAARLWAQAGFWYDAMGVISVGILGSPSDPEMHALRASLLEEVDLTTPAQVDRQHGL